MSLTRRNAMENVPSVQKDETAKDPTEPRKFSVCFGTVDTILCVNNKFRILRHYMLIPWYVRSLVMVFLVSFLSLLQGAREIKHLDALTSKDSILNQVFVKMGWAWTLLSVFTLVFVLLPLCAEPFKEFGRAVLRLVALTVTFYFWCSFVFPGVEQYTGLCLSKNVVVSRRNKLKCIMSGNAFYSFDISGHSFLMAYCTLTLVREARAFRRYISMGQVIAATDKSSGIDSVEYSPVVDEVLSKKTNSSQMNNRSNKMTVNAKEQVSSDEVNVTNSKYTVSTTEAAKFRSVYMMIWPLISLCYVCVCMLCLTWDVVLVITTVYYHTLVEKFLGVTIGITVWAFLYEFLFVKLKLA